MIHDNKVSPTFLDIYPSLETEQIPPYMENFKMVPAQIIQEEIFNEHLVGICGRIQNI